MRTGLSKIEREIILENDQAFGGVPEADGVNCPTDLALRAYQFGYADFVDRIRTYFHVRSCVRCFAKAASFEKAEDPEGVPLAWIRASALGRLSETADAQVRSWWRHPALVTGAASLVVVALSAGIFLRLGQEHNPVYRGSEMLIETQVEKAAGQSLGVRWKSVSTAAYYTLDIYQPDLQEVLFKDRLVGTKYMLKEDEIKLLVDGKKYYCRIEALNDLNERVAGSRSLSFTMTISGSGVLATSAE